MLLRHTLTSQLLEKFIEKFPINFFLNWFTIMPLGHISKILIINEKPNNFI